METWQVLSRAAICATDCVRAVLFSIFVEFVTARESVSTTSGLSDVGIKWGTLLLEAVVAVPS